ncbi:MAG TPA: Gfo/Idh/MocA family oxidoreductase, partial [Methylomirabilota bacterium]|nr:Gfo/Idh/MocA family oxidoreductase [Methylomirabilota bacterium]
NTVLTAVGDLDEKTAARCVESVKSGGDHAARVNVEKKHIYAGLDAYKGVIESGVDVVLLATPPAFRPRHMAAAVEAGKHMFVEKPMATDAPGVRSIIASVEKAKQKKLGVCAGFCWRYSLPEQALFAKVLAGDIGKIQAIYATYNTGLVGRINTRPGASPIEQQIRSWYFHTWLSGDFLVEQAVHAVDWMQWAMGDIAPVKCIAHGGRQTRPPEQGDIYDHFEIVYEYAGGTRGFLFCRQQPNCANDNSATFYGSKGTAHERGFQPPGNHIKNLDGEVVWRWRGDKKDMYVHEHEVFFQSLRDGRPINDGDRMARSTMVAIMGRMSAYTGQEIAYEQALNSQEQLVPDPLTLDTPAPPVKVAMPGRTKFI